MLCNYQYTIADGLYDAGTKFASSTHFFVDRLSQANRQKLVWYWLLPRFIFSTDLSKGES